MAQYCHGAVKLPDLHLMSMSHGDCAVEILLFCRAGLSKAQIADIGVQCREVYSKASKRQGGQLTAAAVATAAEAKGWKFWQK